MDCGGAADREVGGSTKWATSGRSRTRDGAVPSTVVTKKDVGGGSGAINEFEEKGASGLCMRMEHVFEFKAPPKCFFCTKSTKLATSLRCTHPPVKPKRPSSLTAALNSRIPRSGQLRRRREQQQLRSTSEATWEAAHGRRGTPRRRITAPHCLTPPLSGSPGHNLPPPPHLEYHGLLARRPIEAPITSGGAVHRPPPPSRPLDRALSKIAHPQHATRPVPVSMCGTTTSQTTLMPAPALCPPGQITPVRRVPPLTT